MLPGQNSTCCHHLRTLSTPPPGAHLCTSSMVCASARCQPHWVKRRRCASSVGVAAATAAATAVAATTRAPHYRSNGEASLIHRGRHHHSSTPPTLQQQHGYTTTCPFCAAPTLYAQQGAAPALQVEQHLAAKGVVRLDLLVHDHGRAAQALCQPAHHLAAAAGGVHGEGRGARAGRCMAVEMLPMMHALLAGAPPGSSSSSSGTSTNHLVLTCAAAACRPARTLTAHRSAPTGRAPPPPAPPPAAPGHAGRQPAGSSGG